MTRDEQTIANLKKLKSVHNGSYGADIDRAIKVMEQEPCEDAISRAYIEPIIEELENICVNGNEHILDLLADIKNAPPVTPQPKTGHWIEEDMFDGDIAYRCSECDEPFCLIDGTPTDNMYNFCPNCGAKMEVEE